jgi:glutamate--cysteine ligase
LSITCPRFFSGSAAETLSRNARGRRWTKAVPCGASGAFHGAPLRASSLDAAFDLVKGWSAESRESLRNDVPRLGLAATIHGRGLRKVAAEVLHIARAGLAKRNDGRGFDETIFLAPLDAVLADGAEAERLIKKFKTKWAGSIAPCFAECAY